MKVKKNKLKVRHFSEKNLHIHLEKEHCTLIINKKTIKMDHPARDQNSGQEKLFKNITAISTPSGTKPSFSLKTEK